ncbi:glycosyltransferase family 25 protein [Pelagibius litoralis]|uniref:Glycosyltransferase family 25 protein n=1 Tax=Pelagibius litoralis TaxID=374515 RepID=A0A967F106_9PROT|nr:glycosyltransferase family 25 protein [Pelagibius litoralis]NIA71079.1 glycosyltransferase family 25 protein [Pelagibius litoralis]
MQAVKVLVINLARAEARREGMRRRLDALGLDYEFIAAVDGRQLDVTSHPAYDRKRRRYAYGRDLTAAELGCALSHRAACERLLAGDLDQVLVLEDDAVFGPDFPAVMAAILACDTPFDMVRFVDGAKLQRRRRRRVASLTGDYWLVRPETTLGGAHAYLLRRSGAEKLLPAMQRNWLAVDSLMGRSWDHGLVWFTVEPVPVAPDVALESTIGTLRHEKVMETGLAHRLAFPAIRALRKVQETVGKRRVYWFTWAEDRRSLKRSGR